MRKYIDMHCDTISLLLRHREYGDLMKNSVQIDIEKLIHGGCMCQIFASFIEKTDFAGEDCWNQGYEHAHRLLDFLHEQLLQYKEVIALAHCAKDIEENSRIGKISALASIEEGGILNYDLKRLEVLYQKGVRLMTLTWNFENCIGYPNSRDAGVMRKGLKSFGFETVERMHELGMIVDVSHLSDGGFYDIVQMAKKTGIPFAASHSCARSITNHPRNLTDEMLKMLGETGSVAGVNFYHEFTNGTGYASIEDIVRHVIHMVNKAGEDSVAIGSDFDGMDDQLELDGAQKMPLLFEALKKAHFTEAMIDKICYGNAMRLFKEVL